MSEKVLIIISVAWLITGLYPQTKRRDQRAWLRQWCLGRNPRFWQCVGHNRNGISLALH